MAAVSVRGKGTSNIQHRTSNITRPFRRSKPKVAQVSLYRRSSSCRPVGKCQSMEGTSDDLQTKSLRYSPADAGRYAFGPGSLTPSLRHSTSLSSMFLRGPVRPGWMFYGGPRGWCCQRVDRRAGGARGWSWRSDRIAGIGRPSGFRPEDRPTRVGS